MSDNGSPAQKPEDAGPSEHLNIKVTDNNNEVFFKIKRTTQLGKLMNAFCDRQARTSPACDSCSRALALGPPTTQILYVHARAAARAYPYTGRI